MITHPLETLFRIERAFFPQKQERHFDGAVFRVVLYCIKHGKLGDNAQLSSRAQEGRVDLHLRWIIMGVWAELTRSFLPT